MSYSARLILAVIIGLAASLPRLSADEGPPFIAGTFHIVSGLISESDPTNGPRAFVGASVVFEADELPGNLTFEWDFGDGTHLAGRTVSHAFSSPGATIVALTVTELSPPYSKTSSARRIRILPNFAQGDSIVTIGGNLGNWGIEALVSNPSAEAVAYGYVHWPQGCPGECFPFRFQVPSYGTTYVNIGGEDFLSTGYITIPTGAPAPSVRARAVNATDPNNTNDIPVARLSSLVISAPSSLSFPGVRKSATTQSNLFLTALSLPDLSWGSSVSGMVEVRDSTGNLLASAPFSVDPGGEVLVVEDVAGTLGIDSLDQGQVRVVRTSTDGYVWGLLATTNTNGSTSISVGASP